MTTFLTIALSLAKAWAYAVALLFCLAIASLLFGFRAVADALSFLLSTWVLQGLFAAWVAFRFQDVSARISRRNENIRAAYQRKTVATKDVYFLIQRRINASRRYLDTIESEPARINPERDSYRAVVWEWNEKSKVSQLTLLIEFPGFFGLQLDNRYNPDFANVDRMLHKQRLRVEKGSPASPDCSKKIRKLLFDLNWRSVDLARDLMKLAQRDRDIIDEQVEISEDNLEYLSYGRLLKVIFKPTQQA